jgi:hypothetical protein
MSPAVKPRNRDFLILLVGFSLGADADRFEEVPGSPVQPVVNR